ncbi:MAG: hypothetical protein AAF213_00925 [Pseudomonadota bacterium]
MIGVALGSRPALIVTALASLLGFALSAFASPADAFGTQCPDMPAPTYTLAIENQPVRLVENASPDKLKSLFTEHNPTGAASLSHHQSIGGLHHGEIRLRSEFHMLQATQGGRACLGLKQLALTLGYEPVIYISKDRPRGTCAFDAAVEHEYKHLNTDLAILREATPRIRAAAQRSLNGMARPRPMAEAELADARSALQARITAVIDREMSLIEQERNRRQAQIDTPEEYQRVADQCAGQP